MSWAVVFFLTLGVAGQRLLGMFVAGPVLAKRPALRSVADLLPAAVVAAVILQLTVTTKGALTVDARLIGLAVAGVLVWRRAPLILVVLAAAAVTGLFRLLT